MKSCVMIAPEKELKPMREVKELRAMTGLSQVKFAEALGIPLRSLQNWELGERECPQYVADLIEFRITHDKKFKPKENKKAEA